MQEMGKLLEQHEKEIKRYEEVKMKNPGEAYTITQEA